MSTPARRKVVVLIGSTRFRQSFEEAFREEEHAGNVCLTVPCFRGDGCCDTPEGQERNDALHRDKIGMADEVVVIAPPVTWCVGCRMWCKVKDETGRSACCDELTFTRSYIGASTAAEINLAHRLRRVVRYREKPEPDAARKVQDDVGRLQCAWCGGSIVEVAGAGAGEVSAAMIEHLTSCKSHPLRPALLVCRHYRGLIDVLLRETYPLTVDLSNAGENEVLQLAIGCWHVRQIQAARQVAEAYLLHIDSGGDPAAVDRPPGAEEDDEPCQGG